MVDWTRLENEQAERLRGFESLTLCMKVVHFKKEPYDVLIDRSSKWGNPFTHLPVGNTKAQYQVSSRQEAIDSYRKWITEGDGKHLLKDLHELKGKVLGCWCKPQACHGDVLIELIENENNLHQRNQEI